MSDIVLTLVNRLAERPKTLFLIDGLGALLTALLLMAILRPYNAYFGMPTSAFTYLSAVAVCFCIYSTTCFLFLNGSWTPFILIIFTANLLYCVLTISLLIKYYPTLTIIGLLYFVIEIAIIGGLCFVEFKVALKLKQLRTKEQ